MYAKYQIPYDYPNKNIIDNSHKQAKGLNDHLFEIENDQIFIYLLFNEHYPIPMITILKIIKVMVSLRNAFF